tara:strand:+ start:420 stop:845 length:426 start_codon:yes stop_codon:yes gene_type:complete
MSALLFISKGTLFSKQTKHQNSSLHSYLGHWHRAIQAAALERVYISNSIHVVPLVAFKFKLDRFRGVVRAVDCHVFLGVNFRPRNHPGFPFVVVVFRGREERTEAKEEEKGEQCAAAAAAAAASSSREEERCHRDKTNACW